MKIEIINNVTTIKTKNKIYFKIQDIAEAYTSACRIYKVASNLNLLTWNQVRDFKKTPYYKYKAADYIDKEALVNLIQQRVKNLERRATGIKQGGKAPSKFDIQSAIWIRDNLNMDINIQYITGKSNRSNNSVNCNIKKTIKHSTRAMPK